MAQRDVLGYGPAGAPPVGGPAGVWRFDYPDAIVDITPGLDPAHPDPNAPFALTPSSGLTIHIRYGLDAFFAAPDHAVRINVADLAGGESDLSAGNGLNGPVRIVFHNELGVPINPTGAGDTFVISVQAPQDRYVLSTPAGGPHPDYVHFESVSPSHFPNHTVGTEVIQYSSGGAPLASSTRSLPPNTVHLGGVIAAGAAEQWGNVTLHQRDRSRDDDFTITFAPSATAFDAATLAALTARHDFQRNPPALSVEGATAAEGDANPGGRLAFKVALSKAAPVPVTVRYATSDGTATAGQDYLAASGELTFAPGEREKTVEVAALADTSPEPDETVVLTLGGPDQGVTLARAAATGTIANDDAAPVPAPAPASPPNPAAGPAPLVFTVDGRQVAGTPYLGPVGHLQAQFLGTAQGEVVTGTQGNDFVNLLDGTDAADGGPGDDVVDGGLGSNFLTGGAGRDVFFLDGRGSGVTWSTITDWQAGEELSLWGWRPGVSRSQWAEGAGAEGFRGATLHADLDGNGTIDASVTWTGMARAGLPSPTEHAGLLWFHP